MSTPANYYAIKERYLKKVDEVIEKGPYKDTWESLTNMEIPRWFCKDKFGIFIHWGLYSVPAFNNEWYSRNMYVQDMPEYQHHIDTYGPHKDFGYKDFIPMFKAEKWNPAEWISIFKKAGAKYIVPVAEHHDGFQMYDSEISEWNAAKKGPKRDVIRELKTECEKAGLTFCTSSHRAEHLWFMGNGKDFDSDIKDPMEIGDFYWPSLQEQPNQEDIYAKPYPDKDFLDDWLIRTCEIIDKYQPKILYFDWWIQHEGYKDTLKKIAAYYYNRGLEWGFETAICYKHEAMSFGSGIVDVERGKFADVKPYHWQTDTAIAKNSWCYTTSLDYKTSNEIICYLIDVVSKNGNLLLNVGPKADGTIPDEDLSILKDIGDWLDINGESIYGSKVWRTSAEGPTKEVEGKFSEGNGSAYTSKDFRFTAGNGCIYATALAFPDNGEITIESLAFSHNANSASFQGIIDNVSILGYDGKIDWKHDDTGLHIKAFGVNNKFPVVIKVHTF